MFNDFKPMYIYIKTHNKTGLKYFGKTCKKTSADVIKYRGSGTYWKNHIKKHGNDITTSIVFYFGEDEREECEQYCLSFSKINNIVNIVKKNFVTRGV